MANFRFSDSTPSRIKGGQKISWNLLYRTKTRNGVETLLGNKLNSSTLSVLGVAKGNSPPPVTFIEL